MPSQLRQRGTRVSNDPAYPLEAEPGPASSTETGQWCTDPGTAAVENQENRTGWHPAAVDGNVSIPWDLAARAGCPVGSLAARGTAPVQLRLPPDRRCPGPVAECASAADAPIPTACG